jgi:hypothetical protein
MFPGHRRNRMADRLRNVLDASPSPGMTRVILGAGV